MSAPKSRKGPSPYTAPYGNEIMQAFAMIGDGLSDTAIAVALSASRPHGQFKIDPAHIKQLRKEA